jgi:hypothetical protein
VLDVGTGEQLRVQGRSGVTGRLLVPLGRDPRRRCDRDDEIVASRWRPVKVRVTEVGRAQEAISCASR